MNTYALASAANGGAWHPVAVAHVGVVAACATAARPCNQTFDKTERDDAPASDDCEHEVSRPGAENFIGAPAGL